MMFLWSYLQNKYSLGPACSYFGGSEQMFQGHRRPEGIRGIGVYQ